MKVMMAALRACWKLFKVIFLHRLTGDLKDRGLVAFQFQRLEAIELAKFTYVI